MVTRIVKIDSTVGEDWNRLINIAEKKEDFYLVEILGGKFLESEREIEDAIQVLNLTLSRYKELTGSSTDVIKPNVRIEYIGENYDTVTCQYKEKKKSDYLNDGDILVHDRAFNSKFLVTEIINGSIFGYYLD